MTLAERERIAVHEAGHALIAKLLNVGVVEKVSILKRGRALGVTLVTNDQDVTLQSEPEVRARMTMLLGGRGAKRWCSKTASTGAANDLEHVSSMAYRMVTEFGFSKNIGPFSYAGLPDRERRRGLLSRSHRRGARHHQGRRERVRGDAGQESPCARKADCAVAGARNRERRSGRCVPERRARLRRACGIIL